MKFTTVYKNPKKFTTVKTDMHFLFVGPTREYHTISDAITAASNGDYIAIDEGTYNEYLGLSTKTLHLIGRGTTLISNNTDGSLHSTLLIGTNSTFANITFDSVPATTLSEYIITINSGTPLFYNCKVSHTWSGIAKGIIAMFGTSKCYWYNSEIDAVDTGSSFIYLHDASQFNFEGTKFKAKVYAASTSIVTINTDEFWSDYHASQWNGSFSYSSLGIHAYGTSEVNLTVNTRVRICNAQTGVEIVDGYYPTDHYYGIVTLYGTNILHLSGNHINGSVSMFDGSTNCQIFYKDIVNLWGAFWTVVLHGATGSEVTYDNCNIKQDVTTNVATGGCHIYEDHENDGEINIINGSVLEFMSDSGIYAIDGNAIRGGILYMRDSTLIDHKNRNTPIVNYQSSFNLSNIVDIEDSTITVQDSDGLALAGCITIGIAVGQYLNVHLHNVIFNHVELNKPAIDVWFDVARNWTYNDYIDSSGITLNLNGGLLLDDSISAPGQYARTLFLQGNYPLGGLHPVSIEAITFINVVALTDTDEQDAIIELVWDLMQSGTWTKSKAIYPIVGGDAAKHHWNLKDPQDTSAAFRLLFSAGFTHSATGMKPNGITARARTEFKILTNGQVNNISMSFYSRTNISEAAYDMGELFATGGKGIYLCYDYSGVADKAFYSNETVRGTLFTPTTGLLLASRLDATTEKHFHNGALVDTLTVASQVMDDYDVYICAANAGGTAIFYSSKECAFAHIGEGFTDIEAIAFSVAVQKFQTTLGRQL